MSLSIGSNKITQMMRSNTVQHFIGIITVIKITITENQMNIVHRILSMLYLNAAGIYIWFNIEYFNLWVNEIVC